MLFQALSEVDDPEIRAALRRQFASYVDLLKTIIERAQEQGIIRRSVDALAAAWSFLSVGFTLNLVSLLKMEEQLSRERLGLIQELFVRSLLDPSRGEDEEDERHLGNIMGRNNTTPESR